MRGTTGAVLLGLLAGAGSVAAGPKEDYQALDALLREVREQPSDPTRCASWVGQAKTHARQLAQDSCAAGFRVREVHGVNLAIWKLLRVGNVALHRHGCATEGRSALEEARAILVDTDPACLGDVDTQGSIDGLGESLGHADQLAEGVPAANPDLYAPAGGPANHCADESPNVNQIKTYALNWLNNQGLPSGHHANPGSGAVTCAPGDPAEVWRATFEVTPNPPGPTYPETAYVKFTGWKCGLSENPSSDCQ